MSQKRYFEGKDKNALTFYNCDRCGNPLNLSEAALSTTCGRCLNPVPEIKNISLPVASEKTIFELDRKSISYMGCNYEFIIYADHLFNQIVEIINEEGVCIYYNTSAENPEGQSVYNFLIHKQLIKPLKNDTKERSW